MHKLMPLSLLALATTACALIYWAGLTGPLILDDITNLGALQQWLAGHSSWQAVLFENLSGPLGRPLSMATFMADAAVWGMAPFGFKLSNLLLHLGTGVVVFLLLKKIAARDPHLGPHAAMTAAVISAVWLLHPLHVGTVLYVIQRMAMLSAVLMMLTMLAYLHGRELIERNALRRGARWLFIVVPLLTVLAALAKENGLLALLLCGVLEWVYYRPAAGQRRPIVVRRFVVWLVAAPILLGVVVLLARPELFLADYGNRPFTLTQRLLTETRVLFDYVGNLLVPIAHRFSYIRDDYVISTGLFSPWTTALSSIGWLIIIGLAVRLRSKLPAFSAGIGIFLAGHAMESSVFPLMVYFEHRNYLPSLGLLLAVAAVLVSGWGHLAKRLDHPHTISYAGITLLLLVLMFASHGRVQVWETKELLVQQSLQNYPDSRFLRTEMAALEMNRSIPYLSAARKHLTHLTHSERDMVRMIGHLDLIRIDCLADGAVKHDDLNRVFAIEPKIMQADLVMTIRQLVDMSKAGICTGLAPEQVADHLSAWLDRRPQPDTLQLKGRLRIAAAQLYTSVQRNQDAMRQTELARKSGLSDS